MTTTVLLALLKKLEGKVDSLELIRFEPVTELPETGEPNVIYLVPKSDPETGNYSDEYIWDSDNQTYEKIGDTQVSEKPIDIFYYTYDGYNTRLSDSKTGKDIKDSIAAGKYVLLLKTGSTDNDPLYLSHYSSSYIYFMTFPPQDSATGELKVYRIEGNSTSNMLYYRSSFFIISKPTSSNVGKVIGATSSSNIGYVNPTPNANPNIAPAYNATATYDLGDLVIYNNNLYECTTAITVAEAWTAAHWTQKTVAQELAGAGDLPDVTSADAGKMAIVDSNGEWAAMLGPFQQTVTGTLEAGETSITLSHANITTDSVLDIYTDTYGVNPTAVTVAAGSVTLTFEAQASDLGVKVRFFTDVPTPPMNGNSVIELEVESSVEEVTE